MRSDEELLKVACALLEIREDTGEKETEAIMEILEPCTKEEQNRIKELSAEYPHIIAEEAIERLKRHHPERMEGLAGE